MTCLFKGNFYIQGGRTLLSYISSTIALIMPWQFWMFVLSVFYWNGDLLLLAELIYDYSSLDSRRSLIQNLSPLESPKTTQELQVFTLAYAFSKITSVIDSLGWWSRFAMHNENFRIFQLGHKNSSSTCYPALWMKWCFTLCCQGNSISMLSWVP